MALNYLAIVVAATVALVLSAVWYGVLGGQLARLHEAYARPARPAAITIVVELVRNVVVAGVIAGLVDRIDIATVGGAGVLAVALWVAFPVVLLTGSVFHEDVPPRLAAIHAGDWLLKLVTVTAIVCLWR